MNYKTLTFHPVRIQVHVAEDVMKTNKAGEIIGWHKSRVVKALAEALIASGAVFWRGRRPFAHEGYTFDFWVKSMGKRPGLTEVDFDGTEVTPKGVSKDE